jgi:hypothetical protein
MAHSIFFTTKGLDIHENNNQFDTALNDVAWK